MPKKIQLATKASTTTAKAMEEWVSGKTPTRLSEKMKRLTIDVPEMLHRKIKGSCAARGVKMADEIRDILEQKYKEK
jgi:predicted DNA binding CopG/RHH family protein